MIPTYRILRILIGRRRQNILIIEKHSPVYKQINPLRMILTDPRMFQFMSVLFITCRGDRRFIAQRLMQKIDSS